MVVVCEFTSRVFLSNLKASTIYLTLEHQLLLALDIKHQASAQLVRFFIFFEIKIIFFAIIIFV